jgi:hypothetical protein
MSLINTRASCYFTGVKNITITLDERTAAWVRVQAAKLEMSVSRYVGELLHKKMTQSREYDQAMQHWLSRKPVRLQEDAAPYPTRDEINDRKSIR